MNRQDTPIDTWRTSERDVPLLGNYDVVVCDGGPAGCAAAIAGARQGAKTVLIEKYGYLCDIEPERRDDASRAQPHAGCATTG